MYFYKNFTKILKKHHQFLGNFVYFSEEFHSVFDRFPRNFKEIFLEIFRFHSQNFMKYFSKFYEITIEIQFSKFSEIFLKVL